MGDLPSDAGSLLEHAAFVRAVARATVRGDDEVDDVVQETWLAALRSAAPAPDRRRPWLASIVRRRAADLVRQSRTESGQLRPSNARELLRSPDRGRKPSRSA